jgi:hypothetical protein
LTYRGCELYSVLRDHSGYALVRAVATEVTWVHLPIILSPDMLNGNDTVGYVQLEIAAAWRVYYDHNGDAIVILVTD